MSFQICTITGKYATDAESGQQVYAAIHPQLLAGNSIELDFAGVSVFASAFFNFAIGQLLRDLPPDILNTQLKIKQLSPNGLSVLERVIENAKRYYSDSQYQDAVDTVMAEYAASF